MQGFGRYVLLRKLAAGGMAEIFLAKQTGISGFERLVVIKRILPQLSGNREFITMFLDEARTAAQLTHPNVVQIYDMGQIDESYYIAMEYIHGEDLRRVYNQEVQRGSRIPVHFAAHLVAQAAHGLDYAHRKVDISGTPLGLVHRDISPQNLLVSYDGHVKVVDFGVAKAAKNEALTRSGVLKGKYSYMSPEQAQGLRIDSRTDVFALAVVLYEVTCGERLFKRAVEMETLQAVIACEVTPPSKLDPAYPKELERIILKALSKNPTRRHATAGELARDLEEFVRTGEKMIGATELGEYLQELFADKLAEELLMGSQMWEEEHTDVGRKRQQQKAHGRGEAGIRSHVSDPGTTYESEELEEVSAVEVSQMAMGRPALTEQTALDGHLETAPETLPIASTQPVTDIIQEQGDPQTVAARPPRGQATMNEAVPRRSIWAAVLGVIALLAGGVWVAASGVFDAPKQSGPITIESRPDGATIFLDGLKLAGLLTPITLERPLAPGPHHVRLERDGFEDVEGTLFARAGEKATFELDLHAVPPKPVALPPTELSKADVKVDTKRANAMLSVHASIPLRVYNGRVLLGTTPLLHALPPGAYSLRFEHDQSGWSDTRKVTLAANETAKLDLIVAMGRLRINVQPFANIRLGNIRGETPLSPLDLPAGKYTVRLSNQQLGKEENARILVTAGHETALERNWR